MDAKTAEPRVALPRRRIVARRTISNVPSGMQQGLMLLEAVTDANGQVRLTTQQQRSATVQVVETMEQLTDASRQVSATAQQIASSAGSLADLAGTLETTAAAAKDRY